MRVNKLLCVESSVDVQDLKSRVVMGAGLQQALRLNLNMCVSVWFRLNEIRGQPFSRKKVVSVIFGTNRLLS
jgi:hypothetical protein